jgi:hypothetical protein
MTTQLEDIEGLESFGKELTEEAVEHFSSFVGPPVQNYFGLSPERKFGPDYRAGN